jgi:tetratricopeptide (TPR) repeat protein
MALDKNKLAAEATKYVQKSQWDKAIRVYERILAEDPKDVRVLLKIGEIQQRKGDPAGAAETLQKVAQAYTDQGFFLKAVAVYKQIVKLAPSELRVNEKLAGLFQQLGIVSDAVAQLQVVAQGAEAAGDEKKLFEILGRMADLDPDNPTIAVKLGELHAKAGATAPALEQLRRAAESFKRTNRLDDYGRVAERVAALDPGNLALTRDLAHFYLRRGDTKRALAKLQLSFKADPTDTETLGLLASAFRDLGQIAKTVSVYKELAAVETERGRTTEARIAWRRVAELAPDDPDAAVALLGLVGPEGASSAPLPAPEAPRPAAPAPAAPSPRAAVRPPPEAIPKILQETEVFAKYGLYKKALEHLDKVFAAEPGHLDARERARDLCAASGERAAAADHAVRAVETALERGEGTRAEAAMQRLREIAAGDDRIGALEARLGAGGAEEPELELELEVAAEELDEVSFEPAPLDDVSFEPGEPGEPSAELDDVSFEVGGGGGGALDDVSFEPVSPEAEPLAALVFGGELAGEQPAEEPARPIVVELGAAPAAAETGTSPEPDLSSEVDELDFFVQQGLLDEAREALASLLALYPGHPALVQRDAQLRARAATVAAAAPAEDGGFDLGRELAAELEDDAGPPGPDLGYAAQDVFRELERGIAASGVAADDGETHYDLAIAYKEMGLLDDAIQELELAMKGSPPRSAVDCLTMIGLCRLAREDAQGAIEAWRGALAQCGSPEAARALHYELSRAYEALGDAQGALWYLQKVLRADPRFRDARERAERLGGGPGRPPAGDPDVQAEPPKRPAARKIGYV